jgi:nucleotide-sensitive chloride channel 1A
MLPTTIRSPPSQGDYVPLEEYQSQTPESFVDSKPVLHYQLSKATASIPKSQRGALALFPADAAGNGSESTVENSDV